MREAVGWGNIEKEGCCTCVLVSFSVRSGLVSEMLEKNIPFSEWDHLTVLAWLEVSACTIHQAFNIPRANVTQLQEFRGALYMYLSNTVTHIVVNFKGGGTYHTNFKVGGGGGKYQTNFKVRVEMPNKFQG